MLLHRIYHINKSIKGKQCPKPCCKNIVKNEIVKGKQYPCKYNKIYHIIKIIKFQHISKSYEIILNMR